MSRAAIAILSTENLLHNLKVIQERAPDSRILAMIKANAYGHGLRSVALRLEKSVESLGVACIDEALALRKVGVQIPITLMEGVFEPDELLIASCQKFPVVIHHHTQVEWLMTSTLPAPLRIWLKVDTGMGRLGFTPAEVLSVHQRLSHHRQLQQPFGLMSHFACAEDKTHPLNAQQIATFRALAETLPGPRSFANSAAILHFPEIHYETIRPGLALYGVSPLADQTAASLGLKPVMTLQTRLIAIRQMKKGSTIGYGGRFICPEDMPIGVIAIGYGDGYPRSAVDGTPILVNGRRCQLVGTVSMDMMTIDLRACPNAKVGDIVTLWGDGLPIEEVATYTAHIPYDLLCAVQSRVKFHWTLP
jgi:alanine racemase